jgi:hypothetical protein
VVNWTVVAVLTRVVVWSGNIVSEAAVGLVTVKQKYHHHVINRNTAINQSQYSKSDYDQHGNTFIALYINNQYILIVWSGMFDCKFLK